MYYIIYVLYNYALYNICIIEYMYYISRMHYISFVSHYDYILHIVCITNSLRDAPEMW